MTIATLTTPGWRATATRGGRNARETAVFTERSIVRNRTCPVSSPFTRTCERTGVLEPALVAVLSGPWALVAMSALVFADAFTVVLPGEIAVTALGAVAAATGAPPLWLVIVCAALAAALGDVALYAIGRTAGLDRWRWMRGPRLQAALDVARRRLETGAATTLFTCRFVPFARLAVNLMAGAVRLRPSRYLPVAALAAVGWAAYQAVVGALVSTLVPGMPIVGIVVSIVVAVLLGLTVDLVVTRISRRREAA